VAAGELAESIAGADGRTSRLHRSSLAMVGDDLWSDVLAAQRLGMRGVFVLSGKHGRAELDRAAAQSRGGGRPDLVADSLARVIDALD
jgi:ribonucleotide monophosphatase NagD (HAD superfamily)